ncbi:site-specific integrase [Pararhodobacter sp. CCB-MM2]|uniref:tyrosine-type recombinase/integrase n=1 Tax=Pararhodobacter sp. CCB-MM2 TaxID=1786003 RepID=UPI00082C5A84|nr:site-specific integrase [Pararhodobacter sp. CCB-MM2]
MARGTELLTVAKIKSLKKPGHYRDGGGLYLQVSKWGTKSWVFKFTVPTYEKLSDEDLAAGRTPKRIPGKLRSMGLGSVFDYDEKDADDVPELERMTLADIVAKPNDLRLADVRKLRLILKDMVRAGIDPIEHRAALELRKQQAVRDEAEAERAAAEAKALEEARKKTFKDAVGEYLKKKDAELSNDRYRQAWRNSLDAYALPIIGDMSVDEIEVSDVLRVLNQDFRDKSGEVIGTLWECRTETASRLRNRIEAALSWATVSGFRAGDNPARWTGNLKELLPNPSKVAKKTNQPALDLPDLPTWFAELRQRKGTGARALEFAMLCASRSGEVRNMTWDEVRDMDGDNPQWVISADRMKMSRPHVVPLSSAAVEVLKALPRLPGEDLVFPSSKKGKPISDMTISKVMRLMHEAKLKKDGCGYVDRESKRPAVPHGTCRATFRTWVQNETEYDPAMAEVALAHKVDTKVAQAYARGDMLNKRRGMMAHWAAVCHGKKPAGNVVDLTNRGVA